jgi:hypothetical protein
MTPDLAELRKRAESGEYVPYSIKAFALDVAREDEPVECEGEFLHAWTDGTLTGIGLRINSLINDVIYFDRHNVIHGVKFWRLYLTNTAQAGKTLDLAIGRDGFLTTI